MTYAAVPALRRTPEIAARYEPGLTSREYQFGLAEPTGKRGLIAGMGMTEKQGGSDVRANTTRAVAQPDGSYRLTGHKWFTSAPMSDLFLVLAQLAEGVSCFVVPRVLPDGSRNMFHVQRLKDKLGDRSNASSEVEFDGTTGWLVGEPGRGVPAIIEMVNTTRLDCVLGSAATVRAALTQAIHHARHRRRLRRPAGRPAAHAERAGRPRRGERGGHRAGRPAGGGAGRGGVGVPAPGRGGGEVLGLQADAGRRRRGDGGARRQRLRRGLRPPAALPAGPAELDLGGLGQRHRPRRPARDGPLLGHPGRRHRRDRARPRGRRAVRRRGEATARGARRDRSAALPGAPRSPVCWRCACRVRCSSGTPPRSSPTPSAPLAWAGTGERSSARCRPAPRAAKIVERASVPTL